MALTFAWSLGNKSKARLADLTSYAKLFVCICSIAIGIIFAKFRTRNFNIPFSSPHVALIIAFTNDNATSRSGAPALLN